MKISRSLPAALLVATFLSFCAGLLPNPAHAGNEVHAPVADTIEKARQTGRITLGYRKSSAPFSYLSARGPAAYSIEPPAETGSLIRLSGRASSSGEVVVVIAGDAGTREDLRSALCQTGCHIVSAQSGSEAIEVLREHERDRDLIVCSCALANGQTALEAIRGIRDIRGCEVPAVLVTNDSRLEAAPAEIGTAVKPLAPVDLCRALGDALGHRAA